jgi:hypothetical protein
MKIECFIDPFSFLFIHVLAPLLHGVPRRAKMTLSNCTWFWEITSSELVLRDHFIGVWPATIYPWNLNWYLNIWICNTPLWTVDVWPCNIYNPSKTLWEKEGGRSLYVVKDSYNLVGYFRRNTMNIYMSFIISLIKNPHGKNSRDRHHLVCILSH